LQPLKNTVVRIPGPSLTLNRWISKIVCFIRYMYRQLRIVYVAANDFILRSFIQRNKARRPKHMTTPNPEGAPIRKIPLADYNRQYTYLLTNYENVNDEDVYICIYVQGQKVIAGDIHTNSMNGFMHGIKTVPKV